MRLRFVMVIILTLAFSACSRELHLTVLYDRVESLRPEDRVFSGDQNVGVVKGVEVTPKGRYAVRLSINEDFRDIVTEQTEFYILPDPRGKGEKSVRLVNRAGGGKPLSDGATVEGRSSLSFLMEEGRRELEAWLRRFQEEIGRWQKDLSRPSIKEWLEELDREISYWTMELTRAGDEMRRFFDREVLPAIEKAIENLRKHLEQEGREEDIRSLEKRLEKLKSI